LRARIRALEDELRSEQRQTPGEQRQAAIQAFSSELQRAEREYQDFLDDNYASNSENTVARAGDLPPALNRQAIQKVLDPESALVEYVLSDEALYVFVITRNAFHTKRIAISGEELRAKVQLLRELLQNRHSDAWRWPAQSLAESLILPLENEGWLNGIQELNLVPDGELNYLPFAVLLRSSETTSRLLVEDYTTRYLPTASVLAGNGSAASTSTALLAMAPKSDDLPHAQEEAQLIGKIFKRRSLILLGDKASESAFKALAADYDVLHLATHGHFNSRNPMLSAIELEPGDNEDGQLQVHEILNLELKARLVTLSACNTAMGSGYFSDMPAGGEFVGLTRAFLSAGSDAVLASLWEVNDRSTLQFMVDFYQEPGGHDNAENVAAVQRRLALGHEEYAHPYYWAPFVLIGGTRINAAPPGIPLAGSVKVDKAATIP
jgi:CHAT domain-containing protein